MAEEVEVTEETFEEAVEEFKKAVNSKIYVDKTGLIEYTNSVLNTEQRYICISRPRRFGKTMTINMLAAYYSYGKESKEIFAEFAIAATEDCLKYHSDE
mgnify:CR=1 FL=1